MRKLRMAVIGAGRLGGFHAQKLLGRDGVELVAVVDTSAARAGALAAQCSTQALGGFRPLLGQIDAAVIATTTETHHTIALEFLNWGTHLLVEKPLCSTAAQAEELIQAAKRNGAVLQVGHVERFNPALAPALAVCDRPKYVEAVRSGPFSFRSLDTGVVLDLMVHDLDLVLSMARSRVRKVEALGLSVFGGQEDVANARLEFESGCVAVLSASRVGDRPVRQMHVWSQQGFAAIDFQARKTSLVRPSEALLRRELDVAALSADPGADKDAILHEHLPRQEMSFESVDALALELDDFLDSIRTPRAPRVTGEHGRDAVALAERILRKIAAHAWDGRTAGPAGPMASPFPAVIPAPHFPMHPSAPPMPRREAG